MVYESNYLRSVKNAFPYHITAEIGYKTAALRLMFDHHISFIDVNFEDKGSSTLVTCPQIHEPILVEESYFLTVFCDELRTLIMRETAVKVFDFLVLDKSKYFEDASFENLNTRTTIIANLNEVYQWLEDFLKDQGKTLQTALISLEVEDASQLLLVLPFVDGNVLKTIFISSIYKEGTIDFQKIIELDIWNSVTTVKIKCCMSPSTPWQHLCKVPDVRVKLDHVSMDDLLGVVQACVSNPDCRYFVVNFSEKSNEEQFDIFGTMETIDHNGSKVIENSIGRFRIVFLSDSLQIIRVVDKNEETREIEQNRDESSEPDLKGSLRVLQNHLIMEHVLEKLALGTIQALRRVSRGVRQVIDFLKPDAKICGIEIILLNFKAVRVSMFFKDEITLKSKLYYSTGYSSKFEEINESLSKIYENVNTYGKCCVDEETSEDHAWDRFTKEMIFDLQNQKSVIQELCVNATRPENKTEKNIFKLSASIICSLLDNLLKSLDRLLPVKKLSMETDNEEDVLKILRNLDPSKLSVIEIQKPDTSLTFPGLDIIELSTLDQWKQAQELLCEPLIAVYQIESFSHFSVINVHLPTILLQDVVYLKSKFQSSHTFTKCRIVFDVSDINENIFEGEGLGYPHVRSPAPGQPNIWFFQFPDPGHVLHILYNVNQKFVFSRVPKSRAPGHVVIAV